MNTPFAKHNLPVLACKLLAVAVSTCFNVLAVSEVCALEKPAELRLSAPAKIDVPLFIKSSQSSVRKETARENQEILRVAAESLIHYELMKGRLRPQDELPLKSDKVKPDANAIRQVEQAESQEEDENTVEKITKIDLKPIADISLDIREKAEKRPQDLSKDFLGREMEYQSQSDWAHRIVLWEPANLFYNPLYFQDVTLERYGQHLPPMRQSVLSGARFFTDVSLFPLRALAVPPRTCVSPLGYDRPGNCVPRTIERLLPSCR